MTSPHTLSIPVRLQIEALDHARLTLSRSGERKAVEALLALHSTLKTKACSTSRLSDRADIICSLLTIEDAHGLIYIDDPFAIEEAARLPISPATIPAQIMFWKNVIPADRDTDPDYLSLLRLISTLPAGHPSRTLAEEVL